MKKRNRKQRRKNRFKQAVVQKYEAKRRERERETRIRAKPRQPTVIDEEMHWFVAYTAPRQERRAAQSLRDERVTVYEALARDRVKHARKTAVVDRPIFPRYIFIGFPPMNRAFGLARACDGVQCLVSVEGQPLRVRAGLLERIESALQSAADLAEYRDALNARGAPTHDVDVGDQVRVKSGPFQGFSAMVSALLGAEAAEIELSIFGRTSFIHMPVAELTVL